MGKPINLILEDAKNEYINSINAITEKHKLNMYLVEIILKEIYFEIVRLKEQELKQTKQSYDKQSKNNCKKEVKNEKD